MLVTTFTTVLCVALMGLAIQRGGTCFVHAVYEIMTEGHARRLRAILEASLWVTGGLALARLAGIVGDYPTGSPLSVWAVAGGVLLGVGATINRACALGTVAQLGAGNWAYVMTPLGYYLGCLSAGLLSPRGPSSAEVGALLSPTSAAWLAPAFLLFLLWRVGGPVWLSLRERNTAGSLLRQLWSPHAATVTIGASFVVLLLVGGRWSYTDVLADLASATHARSDTLDWPLGLVLTLFAGALLGGLTTGKWSPKRPTLSQAMSCLVGGAVMAWGSGLIPGSNDHLLLIGVPLFQPHAWTAMLAMGLTIGSAIALQGRMQRRAARHTPS